ncbi:RNA polymerase factor sigma-54 [Bacillus timonensis]|nr:RNA polymerase factor sigma-54 [Bacillus timonensis]
MDMKAGLFQQQTLKLAMTKELTQAITLLQYSSIELAAFIQQQAIENPIIEIKDRPYNQRTTRKIIKSSGHVKKENPIDYISIESESIQNVLRTQIAYLKVSSNIKRIAEYVIEMMDDNGYLTATTNEISDQLSVNNPLIIDYVIELIQGLEPAGVGARNLQECLLLQLKRLPTRLPLAEKIIEDYFQSFADKSWTTISKEINVPMSDIQKVLDIIQTFNPKPGTQFQREAPVYIIPDLKVEMENDRCFLTVNDEYTPTIFLNKDLIKNTSANDVSAQAYLEEKKNQYEWLIKSLEQRKITLYNVMNVIISIQKEFFIKGPQFLKPLTMKIVADELGIHESTVSRAVKQKYVQTPYGVFEMKYFFRSGLQSNYEGDASSLEVKEKLKLLIDHENKNKPLSDQGIVDILEKENGIIVSRRTISKYRDQLGIPGSSKRKRFD